MPALALKLARSGVVGTEVDGVMGPVLPGMVGNVPAPEKWSGNSEADVIAEPASEVAEPRLTIEGRDVEGTEGVRDWRRSMRLAREMGCTSGMPFRKRKVLTWTELLYELLLPRRSQIYASSNSPIRTLSRNVLVQRIPGDTLDIV